MQENRVPQYFNIGHIPMSGITPQSLPLCWADQERSLSLRELLSRGWSLTSAPGYRVLWEGAEMPLLGLRSYAVLEQKTSD